MRATTQGEIVPTSLVNVSVIEMFGLVRFLHLIFCEVFVLIHASKAQVSALLIYLMTIWRFEGRLQLLPVMPSEFFHVFSIYLGFFLHVNAGFHRLVVGIWQA